MNTPTVLSKALPIRQTAQLVLKRKTCAFHPCQISRFTTSTQTSHALKPQFSAFKPSTIRTIAGTIPKAPIAQQCRANSTTTAPPIDTTTTTSAPPTSGPPLPWNRFLALRKQRRRISLIASILGGAAGMATGAVIMFSQDIEAIGNSVFGLDPTIVLGLGTLSCLGLGWLLGPFFGNAIFNFMNRGLRGQIAAREREFYARIKKYRVDPSSSSMANPIPDYYGEKIGSVTGYRRWLKDQRAFNLKRGKMQ